MIRVARNIWAALTGVTQALVAALSTAGAVLGACAVMILIAMIWSVVA